MEETLGKRIAFHRKRLGLTQDKLAELLGVTPQAVSKWENDQSCPDIAMLPILAEVFDVTTDELLGVVKQDAPASQFEQEPQNQVPEETAVPKSKWRLWLDTVNRGSLCMALWLILTGITVICNSLYGGALGFADIAISSALFAFGIHGLLQRFSVFRLACICMGGYTLLLVMTGTRLGGIDWFIPLAAGIALLGLDLLLDTLRGRGKSVPSGHLVGTSSKNTCTYDGEVFDCATCFGDGERLIQLPRLSGGRGDVTFGNLIIDLSGCPEIADGCSISLSCAFGSLEILVSRKYRAEAASRTAFGSVETKGAPDPESEATIFLNCKVSFGEISIRYI